MNKTKIDLSVLDVLHFTNEIQDLPKFSYDAYKEYKDKSHFKILYKFIQSFPKSNYVFYNDNVDSSFLNKIYQNIISRDNSFIFSAFLEHDIFLDKLSPNSKWMLKLINKNSTFEDKSYIYDSIISFQKEYNKENNKSIKIDHDSLFKAIFRKFLYEERFNFNLINNYINEFYLENKTNIVDYLFYLSEEYINTKTIEIILDKYKNENIYQEFTLNNLLPETKKSWNGSTDFFIYRGDNKKIENLSKLGFHIDDNNYLFNDKNLFLTLLEVKKTNSSFDYYSHLLKHIKNFNGAKEEDVEVFSGEKQYKTLKTNFEYYSLSSDLKNKNKITTQKIKV